jgi:hypothetical protein
MKYIYTLLLVAALWGCNKPPQFEPDPAFTLITFPNPSRELIRIVVKNDSRSPFSLQILDPKGKVVFEQHVPKGGQPTDYFVISVADFGTGAFHAALYKDGSVYTEKFMVL